MAHSLQPGCREEELAIPCPQSLGTPGLLNLGWPGFAAGVGTILDCPKGALWKQAFFLLANLRMAHVSLELTKLHA